MYMNTITLNNDAQMPSVGLGTWRSDKEKVGSAVEMQLSEMAIAILIVQASTEMRTRLVRR